MTTRTMPAIAFPARGAGTREHTLAVAVQSTWAAFRATLARGAARRRLARSIVHLDDGLLADAGLTDEQRGLGDRLIRRFAAVSAIWSGAHARWS